MVEEPAPSGKAAMTSVDALAPTRAEIGRLHPQALRCGVIAMEGASRAWLALRRVAAASHLTWIKRKISFSSTVIGVGRIGTAEISRECQ
jgi:hypothetical protein